MTCWFLFFCLVVLFKQESSYERRISDWSSDVCSSDLALERAGERRAVGQVGVADAHVDDLDAILVGDALKPGLDIIHHLAAFGAEQRDERPHAQLAPQRRAEDRLELFGDALFGRRRTAGDRKSTRLNSSH